MSMKTKVKYFEWPLNSKLGDTLSGILKFLQNFVFLVKNLQTFLFVLFLKNTKPDPPFLSKMHLINFQFLQQHFPPT